MRERLGHSISRSTAVKFLMMEKREEEQEKEVRSLSQIFGGHAYARSLFYLV